MTNQQLTAGAIPQLRSKQPLSVKPLVQVLNVTSVAQGGTSERFRLEISDGSNSSNAVLATQHNELIRQQQLRVNTVIRIKEHITNEANKAVIVILLDLEVIENPGYRIGNPVAYIDTDAPQQPANANSNRVYAPPVQQARPVEPERPIQQQQQQKPQGYQPPVQQQQNPAPVMQSYVAPQQQYQAYQNAPVASLQAAGQGGGRAMPRTQPIKHLNPYQNKWTIKARVTAKSDIRTWDKGPTNQGKLFSVDLVDSEGSEIRATFFREAVDSFYPMMEVGSVYLFSEGKVKIANRQFSAIRNEYEINFGKEAQIQVAQDAGDIVRVQLTPVQIQEIGNVEPKATIDVIGIAVEFGEVSSFTSKQGKDLKKLEIDLADRSNASVKLSIWGAKADEVAAQLQSAGPNPVIAVKSCLVGDYGGRSLSTIASSTVLVNPADIPQAGALRSWFDQGGGRNGLSQMTASRGGGEGGDFRAPAPIDQRITFDAMKEMGKNGQSDICEVKGYLLFVRKDNLYYPACPTEKCNKKLSQSPSNGQWYCEKCNKSFDQPFYKYIANMNVGDSTGSAWCTAFNETANGIFANTPAQDLERLKREDEAQFNKIVENSQFQEAIFKLKVKEEIYNDQPKLKPVILSYKPIDYVSESRELLKGIAMLQLR